METNNQIQEKLEELKEKLKVEEERVKALAEKYRVISHEIFENQYLIIWSLATLIISPLLMPYVAAMLTLSAYCGAFAGIIGCLEMRKKYSGINMKELDNEIQARDKKIIDLKEEIKVLEKEKINSINKQSFNLTTNFTQNIAKNEVIRKGYEYVKKIGKKK